jgi:hypothetical protein
MYVVVIPHYLGNNGKKKGCAVQTEVFFFFSPNIWLVVDLTQRGKICKELPNKDHTTM